LIFLAQFINFVSDVLRKLLTSFDDNFGGMHHVVR